MPLILHLETATTVCSVALGKDGALLSLKEVNTGYTHAENLTVFIQQALSEANIVISDIDAIAVSKGPGSYTGLRIGVSVAKGLCYAINKPLLGISTLQAMAYGLHHTLNQKLKKDTGNTLYCPMIDARRMEVYCAFYDALGTEVYPVKAEIINEESFSPVLDKHQVIFFGDGSTKCKEKLKDHPHAVFVDDIFPSAAYMIRLSEQAYHETRFEDVAYFEPYYLKDFVAGPKKG